MDEYQQKASSILSAGHNVILTGFPGTGKSHILANFVHYCMLNRKQIFVTASTGKAAVTLKEKLPTDVACQTIHKCFGLLDGRYSNDELLDYLLHDERFIEKKKNILDADIVIVDEVSMVSLKIFTQIEHILRNIKDCTRPFGGIQMVLAGDFFQLPPIPSPDYGDAGDYIFKSELMRWFHHINLTQIHRQDQPDLISAIHNIARGQIESDDYHLLKRLKRSLPPGDPPVHLYATNFDTDLHNARCLRDMDGEETIYRCVDEGSSTILPWRAVKELHLKVGCPVMLLVNLTDELANGLNGVVREVNKENVHVYFELLNRVEVIKPFNFTRYDPLLKKDIGSRKQIPIKLAFAITVHKSQGMTLERVSIDCKRMHQYGQLTVAISRATSKKGLQIKNFSCDLLSKPPESATHFYNRPMLECSADLKCCVNCMYDNTISSVQCHRVEESELNDDQHQVEFNDSDSEDDLISAVQNIEEVLSPEEEVDFALPDGVNIQDILKELTYENPETDAQRFENGTISFLKEHANTKLFIQHIWNHLNLLGQKHIQTVENKAMTNKDINQFFKAYNKLMTSENFLLKTKHLLGRNLSPADSNVIFKISNKLRVHLMNMKVESVKEEMKKKAENEQGKIFEESAGGRGKIRYIAGWCISTMSKKRKKSIVANMYNIKKTKDVERKITEKTLLDHLELGSNSLETSEHQDSLGEIARKQNARKGLTVVSDETFLFFLALDRKLRLLQSSANLQMYGTEIGQFLKSSLDKDLTLKTKFQNLFICLDTSNYENADISMDSLLQDLLSKYMLMSLSQLRRDYLGKQNTKKKEATRKQIKMRSDFTKSTKFDFEYIRKDKTSNKTSSHKRLQSEILSKDTFLENSFTKVQLISLCSAYNVVGYNYNSMKTKKRLCEILIPCIERASCILNPDAFEVVESPSTEPLPGSSLHQNLFLASSQPQRRNLWYLIMLGRKKEKCQQVGEKERRKKEICGHVVFVEKMPTSTQWGVIGLMFGFMGIV